MQSLVDEFAPTTFQTTYTVCSFSGKYFIRDARASSPFDFFCMSIPVDKNFLTNCRIDDVETLFPWKLMRTN